MSEPALSDDILARICDEKHREIQRAKISAPPQALEIVAAKATPPRGFIKALEAKLASGNYGLIAEIKKASPSGGMIRPEFAPAEIAQAYERAGAACLSVLTDATFFKGAPADLIAARQVSTLPVLRKDFMLDPYQVAEARVCGADCILIIMAAVSDDDARALEDEALRFGMDVLVEIHDAEEMTRALHLKTRLLGINNRNLKTLKTDLKTTEELAAMVPKGKILVSESGITRPADLARLARAGAKCFLIGEALLRQPDIEPATRALLAPMPASAKARA